MAVRIELRFVAPEGTMTMPPILQYRVHHDVCEEPDPWSNVPTYYENVQWRDALDQYARMAAGAKL